MRPVTDVAQSRSWEPPSRWLIRRAAKRVEEPHGAGVVPLPGKTAFYALASRLVVGEVQESNGHALAAAMHRLVSDRFGS